MATVVLCMDLSIQHVKETTLRFPALCPYFVADYAYGVFFHTSEVIEEDTPPDLAAVLEFAYSKGCELVRFDRDTPTSSELDVFDWS